MIKLSELNWDSSILGYKCGSIECNINKNIHNSKGLSSQVEDILNKAKEEKYKMLTIKLRAENIELVNLFLFHGAKLIDTEITFKKKRKNHFKIHEVLDFKMLKEKIYWHDKLFEMSNIINSSRFFIDKNIHEEVARSLWKHSIYNSCNGRASYSIICLNDTNKPVGLMNLFEKNNISNIFFIGVLPEYQGKGIGKKMINFYESNLKENIKYQIVETQAINYKAQRLYLSLGYKSIEVKYILHLWM